MQSVQSSKHDFAEEASDTTASVETHEAATAEAESAEKEDTVVWSHVYAIGDCSANQNAPLPALAQVLSPSCIGICWSWTACTVNALASPGSTILVTRPNFNNHMFLSSWCGMGRQVAEQQGKYLARCLNHPGQELQPFKYRSLGALATVGRASAGKTRRNLPLYLKLLTFPY